MQAGMVGHSSCGTGKDSEEETVFEVGLEE